MMIMSKFFKTEPRNITNHSFICSREDDDEIIENSELEPVTKLKKQRTTWSRKQPDNNTNYQYVLPNNVSDILNSKSFSKFVFYSLPKWMMMHLIIYLLKCNMKFW